MSQYDIDFEILYSIKEGNHTFSKIWTKVKGIGSKQTFSSHLAQLVGSGDINRIVNENGKPEYHISTDHVLLDVKENGILGTLDKEIKTVREKSKKKSDKNMINDFIHNTEELMNEYSRIHIQNLILESTGDSTLKPMLGLHKKTLEKIDEFIKKQIDVLKQRDFTLYELYMNRFG